MVSSELILIQLEIIMSKARRVWIVWRCYNCERRHKDEFYCNVMEANRYFWELECGKCRKVNRVYIQMEIRGKIV